MSNSITPIEPSTALTQAQSALTNAQSALVDINPNLNPNQNQNIRIISITQKLQLAQSAKDQAVLATQTAAQSKIYSEQNLKNVQEALALAQSAKEQAINEENIKITLVNEAQNKVTQQEALLMQKQTEITSAEQTKTIADTELVLATNALQKAQQAILKLRQATFNNQIKSMRNINMSGDSLRNVIDSIQESYNTILAKNLSYDLTNNIINQYQDMLINALRQIPLFMPPDENPFTRLFRQAYINTYRARITASLNQIKNNLEPILVSASNQQQNFSNTTMLDPFWNDIQTQTELLQNAVAINSNILPIGINTSNNMSMYASVIY